MLEYENYLPLTHNEGTPVAKPEIDEIKSILSKAFGGYTHLQQRSEGVWRMGGVTFRDEITIIRVLDDGSANFDMAAFKESVRQRLKQESILIISREVKEV